MDWPVRRANGAGARRASGRWADNPAIAEPIGHGSPLKELMSFGQCCQSKASTAGMDCQRS